MRVGCARRMRGGHGGRDVGKISATFDLGLGGHWTQGVRVELLAPGLALLLPKRKAFGGAKPSVVHLDKHALVAFERNGGHTTLIMRENRVQAVAGLRFTEENGAVDGGRDRPRTTTSRVQELALTPDDAAGLVTLADATAARSSVPSHRTLKRAQARQPERRHPPAAARGRRRDPHSR